jgi:flagellar hook-associated protein FlgK
MKNTENFAEAVKTQFSDLEKKRNEIDEQIKQAVSERASII